MFQDILGNDKIKKSLEEGIKNNKISHSYLFLGQAGIGKKMIAKELAKGILCLNEDNKYCNNCKSCLEFEGGNNPDFFVIEPEGNTLKIDQIRNMQIGVQEKPIISSKKVYIIDNADLMTKEAQNALLKTLEEPPEFITIILIGENENAFLPTIKSRCMILHFNQIPDLDIKNYLEKNYNIQVSNNMLEVFQGSIGKAIELKDKQEIYKNIEEAIDNIEKEDLIDLIKKLDILYTSKDEILDILDYINIIFLRKAKENVKYTRCIKIVENTKRRITQNANYDMSIDNMLFNIWEEVV